jgi:hypothetical protein
MPMCRQNFFISIFSFLGFDPKHFGSRRIQVSPGKVTSLLLFSVSFCRFIRPGQFTSAILAKGRADLVGSR